MNLRKTYPSPLSIFVRGQSAKRELNQRFIDADEEAEAVFMELISYSPNGMCDDKYGTQPDFSRAQCVP